MKTTNDVIKKIDKKDFVFEAHQVSMRISKNGEEYNFTDSFAGINDNFTKQGIKNLIEVMFALNSQFADAIIEFTKEEN